MIHSDELPPDFLIYFFLSQTSALPLICCFIAADYYIVVEHVHGNKLPFDMEGVVLPNFIVLCEFSYIYIIVSTSTIDSAKVGVA